MITFFGERSPPAVCKFADDDMKSCDLIVVMGTSLKVGGAVVELLSKARKDVVSAVKRHHVFLRFVDHIHVVLIVYLLVCVCVCFNSPAPVM
jgi:NAD-dependent SIR2 family protein deacetylase